MLFAVQIMSGATNDALDRAIHGGAGEYDVFVRPVGNFDADVRAGDRWTASAACPTSAWP